MPRKTVRGQRRPSGGAKQLHQAGATCYQYALGKTGGRSLRRAYIYLIAGHFALMVPEAVVFAATTGNAILGIVATNLFVAALLYAVAFIRRTERGISAGSLAWRGALTTLGCLVLWFLAFLVLSWFTAESVLVLGFVQCLPLGAVSSGLTAVLGVGLFADKTDPRMPLGAEETHTDVPGT